MVSYPLFSQFALDIGIGFKLALKPLVLAIFVCFALLLLFNPLSSRAANLSTVSLQPTDDTHVVADLSDPFDTFGLRHLNFGSSPLLNVGYQQSQNQSVISIIYLKFNLGGIGRSSIQSAVLQLYANTTSSANLSSSSISISAFSTDEISWTEANLTFSSAPSLRQLLSTTSITSQGSSYRWDVTSSARAQGTSSLPQQLTIALSPGQLVPNGEEHVQFNSKEASQNRPILTISFQGTQSFFTPFTILIVGGGASAGAVASFYVVRRYRLFGESDQAKEKRGQKRERRVRKARET